MEIIKMPILVPRQMGAASIEIRPLGERGTTGGVTLAERKGDVITLANAYDMCVYMLKGGQQFVYGGSTVHGDRMLYFGGMDESPFLVELELDALEGLIGGEDAFFTSLKPRSVRRWEHACKTQAKRQGDFFAIGPKKNIRWPDFFRSHLDLQGKKFETAIVDNFQLMGTRHRFSGFLAQHDGMLIGEGTIMAPDHEPLHIKGPHLIAQAVHLKSPKLAD